MTERAPLGELAGVVALLSLASVGGANAVFPEVHRAVVGARGWMGDPEIVALYALAQAAPGPNVMYVSLIGLRLAGLPGFLAATLAMVGPSGLLAFAVGRARARFDRVAGVRRLSRALVPVALGLVLAGGWVALGAAARGPADLAMAAAAAALVAWRGVNPLLPIAAGAALGALLA